MELNVLGPMVAVTDDGTEIPLGGPKQRAVLALLLLASGRPVETDRLIDELWPEAATDGGRKTVQAYASRLRRVFMEHGASALLRASPSGYSLDAIGLSTDVELFESAVERGSRLIEPRPHEAARVLSDALRLWRGRPFEDAFLTRELELEASRLEERRLAAQEAWAEAELAAGRHRQLIPDLRKLADANPYREALWALLMLALYRTGRQSDALELYIHVARRLAEDLGVEPGPDLRDMQRRILQQDPALAAARRIPRPAWLTRRDKSRVSLLGAAGIVALVTLAVAGVLILRPAGADEIGPRVGVRYPVPDGAIQIEAAGGRLWVLDHLESAITAVSLTDGALTTYALPARPSSMAAGLGSLWVASEEGGSILMIDPSNGRVVTDRDGIDLDGASLSVGADAVWVIREHVRPFLKLDPETLEPEVLDFVDGFGGPVNPDLTLWSAHLWGSNAYIGRVMSLDPETATYNFAGDPRIAEHPARSILANRGAIWFSQPTNGSVTRIDPATREVTATVTVGQTSSSGFGRTVPAYVLAPGPGGIWVGLPRDGKVVLLDDEHAGVIAELELGEPVSVAATLGRVWVLDAAADEVIEVIPGSCSPIPFIGPGADLRGCDLAGKVLVGVDLSGADLRWTDLRGAALQSADLTDADLFGADLSGSAIDDVVWRSTRCPNGSIAQVDKVVCPLR